MPRKLNFYIYKCLKCDKHILKSCVEAHNQKDAMRLMSDPLKEHDLEFHGSDMEWPEAELIKLVHSKKSKKK